MAVISARSNIMATTYSKGQRGFAALFSVIVISLMLLLAVVALGQWGIAGRFMLLDLERKAQSESYARACVDAARISVANDPAYAVSNFRLTVGSGDCLIADVAPNTPLAGETRIRATSTVSKSHTRLEVVVSSASADVTSWKQVVSF
jgi:hypothetical protein